MPDIVKFKSGSLSSLVNGSTNILPISAGTVYFATDANNKGYLYFDKDSTHRIWIGMSEHADKATSDAAGNNIQANYAHSLAFDSATSKLTLKNNNNGSLNFVTLPFLLLTGGNVTGPVNFGSSISAASASIVDLVCTGSASFTNGLSGNLIGNVTGNVTGNLTGTASRATADAAGNNIQDTYAASFSISDHTITLKNKNGNSLGTITVPDNDTKNTAGSTQDTSKLFIIGAKSQGANPQTYSSSKVYITDGTITAESFAGKATSASSADTATKATGDAAGNNIQATYANSLVFDDATSKLTLKNKNGGNLSIVTLPFLKLTGGAVTGPVSFGDAVTIDSLTAGSAVINGHLTVVNGITGDLTGNVTGNLYGNASTATKATQDGAGNNIQDTYVKKSGDTMTGILTTKGEQYSDSYSGALNMNNSNIYGLNSIYTADLSDGPSEGIHFYRDGTHVDTIYAKNGVLYFNPNRPLGANGTDYTVLHSNNYTNYTVTKTGAGASGTWGISISGNAATATKATQDSSNQQINTTYIKGWSWDETNKKIIITRGDGNTTAMSLATPFLPLTGGTITGPTIFGDSVTLDSFNAESGVINGNLSVVGQIYGNVTGNLTGNADTATKATKDGAGNIITDYYITKNIGTAKGDIIYWSSSGTPVRLAAGTNGKVLKLINGVPSWDSDIDVDIKVKLTSMTTSGTYPLMFGPVTINSGTSYEAYYNSGLTVNPGTGTITATTFDGTATKATADAAGNNIQDTYVKKSGDTMTGSLTVKNHIIIQKPDDMSWDDANLPSFQLVANNSKIFKFKYSISGNNVDVGWDWAARHGSGAYFRSSSSDGTFGFYARNASAGTELQGTPAGVLTWGSRRIVTSTNSTAVGSTSLPVYIDTSGYAQPITSYEGTAAKATADGAGNNIQDTYIAKSIGTAKGDIIYWTTSGQPARLAASTDGKVLKLSNGVPTWDSDVDVDIKVKLTSTSTAGDYPLMFGPTSASSGTAYEAYYNSGIKVNPNTATITATNFAGTASKATGDAGGNNIQSTYANSLTLDESTSTLALKNKNGGKLSEFILPFLKLTGGNVTGTVNFGSSISAASASIVDLVVTGSGSFTNGLSGNLTGNVVGNVTGNLIGIATKATADAAGNNIQDTYAVKTGTNATGTWPISITGNAATATNADKVDGYHASDLWRKDGGVWNPNANITLTATANGQEWSFDITRNGYTGTYWHVWDSSRNSMLKVTPDDGKVSASYGFVGNLEGNAATATKATQDSSSQQINTTYIKGWSWDETNKKIIITRGDGDTTVKSLVTPFLPLTGGNVTGPVNFGDSVSMDSFTVGSGIVNGNLSVVGQIFGTLTGHIEGTNDAANPAGALLQSGAGRADSSPAGDTWIYWDTLGGTSSYWGIRHNQGANTIGFCGSGSEKVTISLAESKVTATTFAGKATSAGSADSVAWSGVTGKPTFSGGTTTLSWGTTSTIANVGGNEVKITMPANPNTDHYAWNDITGKPSTFAPSSHDHSQIVTIGDQRSTATTPNSYANKIIFQGLKNNSTIGSPSSDTYSYLIGLRGWSDSSGGNSHELAFNNTGLYWRSGATTDWGNWYRIYTTGNKPTASDVGLGNVENKSSATIRGELTSNNVTTALGYTPYNSSNPNGYTSNTGTITKVTTTAGAHTAISSSSGNVSFNVPTTAAHVGIKFNYTTSGNNRAVQQDANGNLYVVQNALPDIIKISSTAPTGNSNQLWIDTGNGGIAKYWNGSAWVAIKSVWG